MLINEEVLMFLSNFIQPKKFMLFVVFGVCRRNNVKNSAISSIKRRLFTQTRLKYTF